jgi:dTDP-L-rhamnose 4-epimerase
VLLEALVKSPVSRLIFASSMSIFGEGLYSCRDGSCFEAGERSLRQLRAHEWELQDSEGAPLIPIPTPETKSASLPSVYAISKYHQERMCMVVGRAYGIPTVGLRFFNIYGTRQALSNPYTGVLAIFGSRFLNNQRPLINEDGNQRRDFVSVRDIAQACRLALEKPGAADQVFNIGSGSHFTLRQIASLMAQTLDKEHLEPEITGRYRMGDIRHCFADITLAKKVLGYTPRVGLKEGLIDLSEWLEQQTAVDRFNDASSELMARGLSL